MSLCLCMVSRLVYVWFTQSGISLCLCMVHVLLYHNRISRNITSVYHNLCMVHVLLYHNLEYHCVYVWFTSCCTTIWNITVFMYGSRHVACCMVHHNLEYRCVYVWFTSCCTTIWNIAVFMYGSRLVVSQSRISLCLCMVHVLLYHNLE